MPTIDTRNHDLMAYAADWVQERQEIAKMNNADVDDDYEFSFMNHLSQLGPEKLLSSSSDHIVYVPSNTPKPYVSQTFLSGPFSNIPKRKRTKRYVVEISHGSRQEKSKRRKAVKESNRVIDHPFIPSFPRLVIIPPQPQVDPPVLPVEFRNEIERIRGFDIQLVIQKGLTSSDVTSRQACLSIPVSQINENKILTEKERADLRTKINKKNNFGLDVPLIDPELRYTNMILKWWIMEKGNGTSNPKYALTHKWNKLVTDNDLHTGEVIQLWSFRVNFDNEDDLPKLRFALVRV